MAFEIGDDDCRYGNDFAARVGLRWAEHECAVTQLLVLLDNNDRPVQQVKVSLAKRSQRANPKPAEVASSTIAR